jgi:CRISPR-associated protein Cas2
MRMLVFFDLPTESAEDRKNYASFRKLLIKNGFLMMQKSVYCKLLMNMTAEQNIAQLLRKKKPPKGVIQILTITEKQFARMEFLTGEFHSEILDSDERLVVI